MMSKYWKLSFIDMHVIYMILFPLKKWLCLKQMFGILTNTKPCESVPVLICDIEVLYFKDSLH